MLRPLPEPPPVEEEEVEPLCRAYSALEDDGSFFVLMPAPPSRHEAALQCLVSSTMQQIVEGAVRQHAGTPREADLDLMRWLTNDEAEEDVKPEAKEETTMTLRKIAETLERIEAELKDSRRTTQFLCKENTVLRSRQMERENLSHELRLQRQYGLNASIEGIAQQLAHISRQQNAMLDALREFNLVFDAPPRCADDAAFAPLFSDEKK